MKKALHCPNCEATMKTVDYKIWGTKRFDAKSGIYSEDDGIGSSDMEFSCPNCSERIKDEQVIEQLL
jgi:hypothetical protein